ncbi:MAG: glycoside hydrolase family 130 protein [Sedimentisphaerales bacterium]|nr:glycoside hydrolase family 130 protein [Sedimentisphaerales bacterium]
MIQRNPANPIIKPEDTRPSHNRYRVRGTFNPGAVKFGDETILLLRVSEDCLPREGYVAVPYYRFEAGKGFAEILEVKMDDPDVQLKDTRGVVHKGKDYLSTISHIRLARSRDGIHFTVDDKPFIYPCNESECFGVEDARVTKIDDLYYINYTVVSGDGFATALATTQDFINIEQKGIIFAPQNKDVSIFPEKVNGKYCALHRPNNEGFGLPSIWYSESPDLIHWGNHKCILRPRNMIWEEMKIGGGAAPIKTSEGWLEIYHGKGRDQMYSLFPVLLDLEDPSVVLKRAKEPILFPIESYETEGFFPNVVFSNGIIHEDNGRILIYYGACDETVCLAETSIDMLLSIL